MKKFRIGLPQKAISLVLALIMAVSLLPLTSLTVKAQTAQSDTTATVGSYTIVVPKGAEMPDGNSETTVTQITNDTLGSTKSGRLAGGWYVVTGTVNLSKINITGDINLILADGASFTVTGCIEDSGTYDHNFTVWAQSAGTGKLQVTCNLSKLDAISANNITVNGGTLISSANDEGGGLNAYDGITVNGGNLTCTGVDAGIVAQNNIVINGGVLNCAGASAGIISARGAVTINGGNVTATGTGSEEGVGIYANKNLTINGGTVIATGTGEGIYLSSSAYSVTINGGTVTATGSGNCAEGAGVGIEAYNLCINGGELTLSGGDSSSNIPGNGIESSYITISGGKVKTWGSVAGLCSKRSLNISGGEIVTSGLTTAIYAEAEFTVQDSPFIKAGDAAPGSAYSGDVSGLNYSAAFAYKYVSIVYPTDAVLTTAPTATGSVIYAGSATALVNAGSTSTGTLKYRVLDSTDAVISDWSSALPTAAKLSAGSYKVCYMIEGDDTHYDAADDSWYVDVTVSVMGNLEIPKDKEAGNYLSGGIASSTDEVLNAVLTDSEKAMLATGTDISVWAQINDISSTVSPMEKEKIESYVTDLYEIGGIIDITLWKRLLGSAATKVTDLPGGKIKISLQLPTSMVVKGRVFRILRLHGSGQVEIILATVDENNVLTFETDKFSTYVLLYQDESGGSIPSVPKTGDTRDLWLPALLAATGMGLFVLSRRKKHGI